MKKLLLLAGLLLSTAVVADGVKFFKGSFEGALAKAGKQNKLVFVDAYTTWCGPCKMMELNVFPLKDVGNFYNTHFVSLKLDTENEDQNGPELSERYDVRVLPTYLFIKPDGEVQHRGTGFFESELFIALGREALGEKRSVFADLEKRYQDGERDPAFVRQYLAEAIFAAPGDETSPDRRAYMAEKKKVFDAYIDSRDKKSLINTEDFGLMESYLLSAHVGRDNEYVDFVAQNYNDFIKVAPESQVAFFLLETVKTSVSMTASAGDASYVKYIEELDGLLAPAYKCQLEVIKNDYVYREYLEKLGRMQYRQATRDWGQMLKDIEAEIAARGDSLTATDYSGFASGFWRCNDPAILDKALGYARKGYEMAPSARTAMSYIGLLQKMGENAEAIDVAEQTLASVDENSKDGNFIDALNQMLARLKAQQ